MRESDAKRKLDIRKHRNLQVWQEKEEFVPDKMQVCRVIIDGGSTDNLVGTEMVQKLKLTCIPKSHPYKTSWLKKNYSVLVNQSRLIDFKVGAYEESF